MTDHTQRFSGKVDAYAEHRPEYPPFVLEVLREKCGLAPRHAVADVGCGTGKLARLLVENGNFVFGIEPNEEMWRKLHQTLGHHKNFVAVEARAEDTALPPQSVDFVTAAQALHWFDVDGAAKEWRRILRPDGWVAIVYNSRRRKGNPFLEDYEQFLATHGIDYTTLYDREVDVAAMLGGPVALASTEYVQDVGHDAFIGRVLSTSYIPRPHDVARYRVMIEALDDLFVRHAVDGRVRLEYDTEVQYGRFTQ